MRSGIRRLVGLSMILGFAAVACIVSLVAATPDAYAGHETRTIDLQESGIDLWIVGLTIGLVVLGLILFAAVMLAWERRDEASERRTASGVERHPKS